MVARQAREPAMNTVATTRFRVAAVLLSLLALPLGAVEKDVIFEPTPMPIVRAMLELAKVGPDDVVMDLGSGDGRIPITAVKEYGARGGVGVDIDPALIKESIENAKKAG